MNLFDGLERLGVMIIIFTVIIGLIYWLMMLSWGERKVVLLVLATLAVIYFGGGFLIDWISPDHVAAPPVSYPQPPQLG